MLPSIKLTTAQELDSFVKNEFQYMFSKKAYQNIAK